MVLMVGCCITIPISGGLQVLLTVLHPVCGHQEVHGCADTCGSIICTRAMRSFFEKSFRLGESDLPTRLRIELEAVEAERQSTRARIDLAAAISALRQALGLLPEQK